MEGIPKTVNETCFDLSICRSNHGFAYMCFFSIVPSFLFSHLPKSVMWFLHLSYIIASGSSFCHHPCERQDQEESSQISALSSHPTAWASASHGIHWSIPSWFSRASRILEALVIAQTTSPSCSSRPALAIGIGRWWCKVHLGWQQSYHHLHEPYPLWPQVSPWITSGKNSCDGWWLPRYM